MCSTTTTTTIIMTSPASVGTATRKLKTMEGDKLLPTTTPPVTKTKKRVRWSTDENDCVTTEIAFPLLVPASEMSELERRNTWYQSHEYIAQKQTAKNLASSIRKREPCDPKHGNPSSYTNVIARVFASCVSSKSSTMMNGPNPQDMERLVQWTCVAHSRRGLERWSIPQLNTIRKQYREKVVDAVLDCQDEGMDEETICQRSERKSKSSRLFALYMGKADELAAHAEHHHERQQGGVAQGLASKQRAVGPMRRRNSVSMMAAASSSGGGFATRTRTTMPRPSSTTSIATNTKHRDATMDTQRHSINIPT